MTGHIILDRYSIYRVFVLFCTGIMLGLFQLFPSEYIGGYTARLFVAVCGLFLALSALNVKNPLYVKHVKSLHVIVGIYCVCVLIALIHTRVLYNYSLYELLVSVMPYLFVFYAYPLLYLFCRDGGIERTISSVTKITLVFLLIKGIIWLLYNYFGIVLFPQMLFEYGDAWVRDGIQRVNAGYLVGVSLSFCIIRGFTEGKHLYKIFTFYIVLFLLFVTAYRFQFLVSILTIAICLYYSGNSIKSKINRRIVVALLVLFFIASPFVSDLMDSFNVNNSALGTSTSIRLLTFDHFDQLMKQRKLIIGLGLLIAENSNALALLQKSQWRLYYLEDIGIFGAWFRFGILIVGLYGRLFYLGIKNVIANSNFANTERVFMLGIAVYMITSCLMLNILDLQRAYDFPFYASIICFFYNRNQVNDRLNRH